MQRRYNTSIHNPGKGTVDTKRTEVRRYEKGAVMTYGQQPQGGRQTGNQPYSSSQPQYGQPYAQAQDSQAQQNAQYYAAQQSTYAQQATFAQQPYGGAPIDTDAAYSYESAVHTSMTRAYAEMAIGLLVTIVSAVLSYSSGLLVSFLSATGTMGLIGVTIAQLALVFVISARVMNMSPATSRILFYVYAATMGFTLSSIFLVYNLGSIGMALGLSVGFFFALTMLALTTKRDMLKAGPILLTALIVLVIGQLIMAFILPTSSANMLISAIGLVIFAGLTAYDAQKTRALYAQYANQPEVIKRLSIVCALNLYLDFVNIFLYLLRLFGSRD